MSVMRKKRNERIAMIAARWRKSGEIPCVLIRAPSAFLLGGDIGSKDGLSRVFGVFRVIRGSYKKKPRSTRNTRNPRKRRIKP